MSTETRKYVYRDTLFRHGVCSDHKLQVSAIANTIEEGNDRVADILTAEEGEEIQVSPLIISMRRDSCSGNEVGRSAYICCGRSLRACTPDANSSVLKYVCTSCGKKFVHVKSLAGYGGRFGCDQCGKSFKLRFNMERHRKLHCAMREPDGELTCSRCEKQFRSAAKRENHRRYHCPFRN